ncbi:type VII secretion integral membrane protein EccD [Streptomyces sp. NBC_01239]|uniref:type VII secretion integral membrane protein EccD n=1 Tax=Streptomyces sp. NBC_01239 TaxID=2903792 RepID=UPI0022555D00|nr:type VII secretion integral membrane protein EccD [Streptomyces sp. NBC_01239]MCX4817813.1 type VII secretion integral membrane protein EccD [Streptomyces sp. NBC_01239]
MTTAVPLPARTAEVCRLTVEAPDGRADLAVPVTTPVSALLPVLLRHTAAGPDTQGTPWTLQRLGEDPLDPEATPESAGLRDGDVLHLRPAEAALPALHFDDVSDGVAHTVGSGPGRWRPELTRKLGLALACLALAALAAALLGAGPGPLTAMTAGVIALVLAAGCASAARMHAVPGAILVAGVGAFGFAALAGTTLREGPGGGFAPGTTGILVAAGCVVALAGGLLALGALPLVVPGTVLLTAVAAAVGAGLAETAGLHGFQAASVVAVGLFVLGHLAPRLALRTARLRVPQLPHDAEELQQDIEPEPGERVTGRVTVATACLDTIGISSALVWAVALWLLADREHGWTGWLLPLCLSLAVLLRARGTNGTLQRVPAVLAGAYGLGLVLIVRVAPTGPVGRASVLAALLAAALLLLVGAWRLPRARLLPVWGHLGDLLETVTAIALLPLLLQVLHAYAYFRGLAG